MRYPRRAALPAVTAALVSLVAPPGVLAAVVVDTVLFNATTNVVADGDEPPGLSTGFSVSSAQSLVDDPEDAFGNNDGDVEPGTFIFGDGGTPDNGNEILGDGGETVDFIEWQTASPVTIAGYRLTLTEADPFGRRTELVRFLVDGMERDFFDNDSATGPNNSTVNVIERPFGASVTASTFRLELTRASNGPRIHEIDALVDASEAAQINVDVAGAGSNPMAPTETAGAPGVADDNWTNLAGTAIAGGPVQVLGGDGLPVPGAIAAWTGFGQGDGLEDGGGNDDAHMLSSLFDARAYPAVALTVTGVPFATYDVYAYHQGGAPAGLKRVARFTVGDVDLYSLRREDFAYVESASTEDLGAGTDPGSHVVFRGLSDPDLTLTVGGGSASDGFQRARFAGVQIVEATTTSSTTTTTSSTTTTATTSTTTSSTTTTTTTTAPTTSTTTSAPTTTTLPAGAQLLSGKKLLLRDKPGKPGKRGLMLVSRDRATTLGAGNESEDDPVVHGGRLRVYSSAGDGFDDTYDLPRWRYLGKRGANKGYKLRAAKPVKSVLVKPGKGITVVAKGAMGHSLGANPAPVAIELTLGAERYCFGFPASTQFKAGKKLLAKNAAAPAGCPP